MTNVILLIGDLGGGKTTLASLLSLIVRQASPQTPQISNTHFKSAHRVEDTNKWIAIKLIKGNKTYALYLEDEAAQSGLESRGSGSKEAAIESRVVTLARKAHIDFILITQLMSMLDKRAQWMGNINILCESVFLSDNETPFPDYFAYTVFDSHLKEIGGFEVDFIDCVNHVFPNMDTDDIPFFENLKKTWENWYEISKKDYEEFDSIMEEKPLLSEVIA